jgi:CDP-diacylglycerol--glycerol-3-phosphate 3-phosphatidyltransferase
MRAPPKDERSASDVSHAARPPEGGKKARRARRPRPPIAPRRSIREDAFNLPNFFTMLRVAVIPLVLWLVYDGRPEMNYWAAWIYAGAAATDALDGWLARRRGIISVFGQLLDPLADKLLIMSLLVVMTDMGRVPAWATIIIVGRELSITALRTIAVAEGVVIAASQGGKEKAALQMVAVLFLVLHHTYDLDFLFTVAHADLHEVGLALLYGSVFFAITSAGEYVKLFVEAVEAKEKRLEEQRKRREEREERGAARREAAAQTE